LDKDTKLINNKRKGKSCFIVTPIGNENTDIRRSTEGVLESVLIPELLDNGYDMSNIRVAHKIHESGSINNQVIKHLIESDMVIVNLTTLNPNVMYELAVRDASLKPAILICEKGTVLPFDVKEQRTIFFENDMLGVQELRNELRNYLKHSIDNIDNPITRGYRRMKLINEDKIESIDAFKYLIDKVEEIARNINITNYKKNIDEEQPNVTIDLFSNIVFDNETDHVHNKHIIAESFKSYYAEYPQDIMVVTGDCINPNEPMKTISFYSLTVSCTTLRFSHNDDKFLNKVNLQLKNMQLSYEYD